MKFYSVKEFSELTGLKQPTTRKHIRNKKIKAQKDINGFYLIPKSEATRYLDEQKKLKNSIYFNIKDLEALHIPTVILYDGILETAVLCGQTCVSRDNLKKRVEKKRNLKPIENKKSTARVKVVNLNGVCFDLSSLVCKSCKKHLQDHATDCEILYEKLRWHYPTHGVIELFEMKIASLKTVTIICSGAYSEDLLYELIKMFSIQINFF